MKLAIDDLVAHPIDLVYRTYRDKLPELVPYLDDVDRVEVRERREEGGTVFLVNHWVASASSIPPVAKAFIKPENVQWTDRATWEEGARKVTWTFEPSFFRDQVRCGGENLFLEDEATGGTIIQIRGNLEIADKGMAGVPNFVWKKVRPGVEKFVVSLIEPNLTKINRGLERYLSEQSREP